MKLSYIVPLYNAEHYLRECLDSVLNSDLEKSEYEIIVVDDGSTDNGLAVAQEYAERHSNILVFHQENQGQSVARNLGIKEAKGDYLWFVDSDDYVDATNISSILEMMDEKDIEICKFEMKVFRADGTCYLTKTDNVEFENICSGEQLLIGDVSIGSVCNSVFSRQFILDNNLMFYPGIVRQDTEFSIRAVALSKEMIYLNQHIYCYRYNDDSCTRSNSYEKRLKSYLGEAVVARNIHQFAEQASNISNELKNYLYRYATSIIKGRLISFVLTKDKNSIKLYRSFVEKASSIGEFPIDKKHSRLFDKVQFCLLNSKCVMSIIIKLRNIC